MARWHGSCLKPSIQKLREKVPDLGSAWAIQQRLWFETLRRVKEHWLHFQRIQVDYQHKHGAINHLQHQCSAKGPNALLWPLRTLFACGGTEKHAGKTSIYIKCKLLTLKNISQEARREKAQVKSASCLFFFYVGVFCLHLVRRGKGSALDLLKLELQMVATLHVGARKSYPGLLKEQPVLLTTKPSSVQSLFAILPPDQQFSNLWVMASLGTTCRYSAYQIFTLQFSYEGATK